MLLQFGVCMFFSILNIVQYVFRVVYIVFFQCFV